MKVAEMRCGGQKWDRRNASKSLLIPVFCCMAFAVEYWYTARNIGHPTVIPRDVSFTPGSGDFYTRGCRCILNICATIAKMPQEAYLAQFLDASLYCILP